jgi:serine/threonine-protein kinase
MDKLAITVPRQFQTQSLPWADLRGNSSPPGQCAAWASGIRILAFCIVAESRYTQFSAMQQKAPWLVAQRYEVGEVVGRGGYGMVCRGVDRETGRAVALKMLSTEAGRDPDVVERMLREQQALLALRGTCAVSAVDLCRLESGAPCLVMEWLDGRDLEHQLSEREAAGTLGEPDELLALLAPITATLERAHDMELVHRDIKPANIFLTKDAKLPVRLLDFGLSRMKSAAPITAAGMVMGSPSYISPETWAGDSRALDGRADLFSLAVIVFRWLTGKLPFDAPDLLGKMTAVTSGPRPSVLLHRPDLPQAVDGWMKRALAIQRDDRYQTGGDFYEALAAALRGQELPLATAEASGIRKLASGAEAMPRKNALVSAWQTATSLLKRFTTRDSEPPTAPEAPSVAAEEAPRSERLSIWLDSDELEDVASQRAIALAPSPPTPAPASRPRSEAKPPKAGKAKKGDKKPRKPKKSKKPHKASGKAKKGRKR